MTPRSAPRLLQRNREDDDRDFVELAGAAGVDVFDTIVEQAIELVRSRSPGAGRSAEEMEREARALLGKRPEAYGVWAHFPWSRRLVHVLPQAEYVELRSSRNRNKITASEQTALGRAKLGVVGLSVGQATAVTLALEGIGAELRLADHDALALSNMNRLRAGVHEIGVNKAEITARAIYEINPYARLELFTEGLREDNIERFLDGLDLVFDECDDLAMKVRLREVARTRRIPVLMETSDRGMIDVERFDLEPDRRILHGLVADVDSRSLRGLTTAEKVPFVLALIGGISARGAASLVDIDATLETWPQLASAVALGGAVNTDCARRVLLGSSRASGRFYVDMERIVAPGVGSTDASPPSVVAAAPAPEPRGYVGTAIPEGVEAIVRWASLAPSGGNCQPWEFVYRERDGILECWHAARRSESMLDFQGRAAHVALGGALENARLACVERGVGVRIERLPGPQGLAWTLRIGEGPVPKSPDDARLCEVLEARATNRRVADRRPLPPGVVEELVRVAVGAGAELDVFPDARDVEVIGELVARAEKLRILHPALHREMVEELRWSPEEAGRTRDGIDVATLELSAADAAGLSLLRSPVVVATIREVGGGEGLKKMARKAALAASAMGLLRVAGPNDMASYLRGGEAMQRVWLLANAGGVAVQPMTTLIYLLARLEQGGGEGLDEADRAELSAIRARLDAVVGRRQGTEILLMRFAVAAAPSARSLRRRLPDVLSIG